MKKLIGIIVLSALLSVSTAQNAALGAFPSHVGLHMIGGRFGEGVILNENHILTVARNVFNADLTNRLLTTEITVTAGVVLIGANPTGLPINRIYVHDRYNTHTGEFNVAVLRMVNNFVFTPENPLPNIAPVVFNNRIVGDGVNCQLVGWNAAPNTLTQPLQSVPHPIMNRNTCNALDNQLIRGSITDQHLCAGVTTVNTPICNNIDGAGLYCENQLVGLRTSGRQCNVINSPAVLIQTRWFQDWIAEQFVRVDDPAPAPPGPPGTGEIGETARVALLGDFPAHVALILPAGRFAEGVIVNQNHIFTLAQNVFGLAESRVIRLAPADISVSAGVLQIDGTPTAGLLSVMRIYAHDHYNFHTGKFNAAVLRLTNAIPTPEIPLPIPLIEPTLVHDRIVPEGSTCQLVSFRTSTLPGGVTRRTLEAINIQVFGRQQCNAVENEDIRGMIFDQHMCVGGTAQISYCGLSDGAVYYCDGEFAGLRSMGMECQANSPGVLIQARWFNAWITQQFARTDNPAPGLVSPPGLPDGGGASTIILSAVAAICAVAINFLM